MMEECKGNSYNECLELLGLTILETRRVEAGVIEV